MHLHRFFTKFFPFVFPVVDWCSVVDVPKELDVTHLRFSGRGWAALAIGAFFVGTAAVVGLGAGNIALGIVRGVTARATGGSTGAAPNWSSVMGA